MRRSSSSKVQHVGGVLDGVVIVVMLSCIAQKVDLGDSSAKFPWVCKGCTILVYGSNLR